MNAKLCLLSCVFLLVTIDLVAQTDVKSRPNPPSEYNTSKKAVNSTSQKVRSQSFKKVIYFDIDEVEIDAKSEKILNELYEVLENNENLAVDITGHSNGNCDSEFCQEISNNRAESVAFLLLEKGLSPMRIQYNGLGKQKPKASNKTPSGRKKNQRVEIKVYNRN